MIFKNTRAFYLSTVLVLASTCTACAHAPETAATQQELDLVTRHTSVFNKIQYRIPQGWVVTDGESDWVAPSDEKQFWQPGFDTHSDAYYVVAVVFPYLTVEDMKRKRRRTLEQIASATAHSLVVASNAKLSEPPRSSQINGKEAVRISAVMNKTHVHHQVLVGLSSGQIATVSGNGPLTQSRNIRALVDAIARTVEPGVRK